MTQALIPILFAVEIPEDATRHEVLALFVQYADSIEEVTKAKIPYVGAPVSVTDEQLNNPDFGTGFIFYGKDVLPLYEAE